LVVGEDRAAGEDALEEDLVGGCGVDLVDHGLSGGVDEVDCVEEACEMDGVVGVEVAVDADEGVESWGYVNWGLDER
jgi:hypothetical protein